MLTRKALDENQGRFSELIGRLRGQLESSDRGDNDWARLQEDIDNYKQYLELCKRASNEVSNRKIHSIREAITDSDSD